MLLLVLLVGLELLDLPLGLLDDGIVAVDSASLTDADMDDGNALVAVYRVGSDLGVAVTFISALAGALGGAQSMLEPEGIVLITTVLGQLDTREVIFGAPVQLPSSGRG